MNHLIKLFILFLIFSAVNIQLSFSSSVEPNAGTTGAVFLRLGIGVRAIGMGGVFTSIPDGINSTYGNPAGVVNLQSRELTLIHNEWLSDISYGYAGYAHPLSDKIALAGSIIYVDYGSFEGRGNIGERIADPTASDKAIALTVGGKYNEKYLLGSNIKYIEENFAGYTAKTYSFDFGAIYYSEIKNLIYGASIQNIGPKIDFVKESFSLPLTFRTGVSYYALQDKLIMGVDLVKARDTKFYFSTGLEFNFKKIFSLRAGYSSEKDIGRGYAFGTGVSYSYFNLDYAYSPYGDLGDTHRLSLTLKF